jgi:hypothetical protein
MRSPGNNLQMEKPEARLEPGSSHFPALEEDWVSSSQDALVMPAL